MQVDYGAVLRRAWDITWRNKTLWWLGLFAGGAGASGSNWSYRFGDSFGSNASGSRGAFPLSSLYDSSQLPSLLSHWLPFIAARGMLLLLLILVSIVLSIAASGGLVTQANEAAESRRASASRGWGDGFRRWWRLAGIYAVLSLPLLAFGLLTFGLSLFVLLIPFTSGGTPTGGSIAALVGLLAIATLVLIPLGIVLGVLRMLATRYAMLEDRTWSESISAGWGAIRGRLKDVALMWLLLLGVSIGFGLAIFVPFLFFAVPLVALAIGRLWIPFALVIVLLIVVIWVLAAAFNTFHSATWTVFWRQMTGREPGKQVPPYPAGYGAYPGYAGGQPAYPPPSFPQYPAAPPYPQAPGYPEQPTNPAPPPPEPSPPGAPSPPSHYPPPAPAEPAPPGEPSGPSGDVGPA